MNLDDPLLIDHRRVSFIFACYIFAVGLDREIIPIYVIQHYPEQDNKNTKKHVITSASN